MNTFDNTNCRIIDWSKLELDEHNGRPVEIKGFGALVEAGAEPMLLDTEIVGKRPVGGSFKIEVYEKDYTDADGTMYLAVFPLGTVTLSVDEVRELATTEVPIAEYVGDRRNYNGRLATNERLITEWLNDGEKSVGA